MAIIFILTIFLSNNQFAKLRRCYSLVDFWAKVFFSVKIFSYIFIHFICCIYMLLNTKHCKSCQNNKTMSQLEQNIKQLHNKNLFRFFCVDRRTTIIIICQFVCNLYTTKKYSYILIWVVLSYQPCAVALHIQCSLQLKCVGTWSHHQHRYRVTEWPMVEILVRPAGGWVEIWVRAVGCRV